MVYKNWIMQTLSKLNINSLNKIQNNVSMIFQTTNKNIIGVSNTGSGKTLAFLLPILNNLDFKIGLQSIIICPTKELSRQIYQVLLTFKKNNNDLNIKLVVGGNNTTFENVNKFQIIIATPNKLIELINKHSSIIDFSKIQNIVLDEADMLFDLGFFTTIDQIIKYFLDKSTQIRLMAFSATFHDLLANRLKKYFTNTELLNYASKLDHNQNIEHNIIYNKDKYHSLSILLNTINPYFCLIFANKNSEVDELYSYLKKQDRNVIKLHSNLQDRERKNAYNAIKKNLYKYVVCSDLLSRGLDIDGASHVISWNIPNELEWYFHRSGRTGRGKYTGYSYILSNSENDEIINRLIKHKIKFNYFKIKNNNLCPIKSLKKTKPDINPDQKNEINKILKKPLKKKPGYKKKLKQEIDKVNKKYKRQAIDKKIKTRLNSKQN